MSVREEAEELACLDVLGLLDPTERAAWEMPPDSAEAIRTLRRELNESACQLAWLAPASEPPARLRARVLAAVSPARETAL
ncbi:MAG: hypothetical protein FJ382_01890 [Verrucomicrobia bacterium]|nr:hypothetical protein [Verrucomicrobiota bacterium]